MSPRPLAKCLVFILLMTIQVIITDITCLVVFVLNLRSQVNGGPGFEFGFSLYGRVSRSNVL